jgi:diacylglycerol O-acyltransferase
LRRYHQRPVRPLLDLALPRWIDDPDFDVRRHVRYLRLAVPGGDAELHALVDRLFAAPLEGVAPLWEICLIDGVAGGRAAILTKVHHCMIDGVSGAKVLEVMTDPSANAAPAMDARHAASPPDEGAGVLGAFMGIPAAVRAAVGATVHPSQIFTQARAAIEAARTVAAILGTPLESGPLNGTLGTDRRIVWTAFPLDEFLAMRGAAGCKVNDVVLAVITGAVRRYLLARGITPPAHGVRTLVPVNVRRAEDALALGNRVSALLATLPVQLSDPLERLACIAIETRTLKAAGQSRAFELALALAGTLPAPSGPLLARLSALRPFVHTVCTNVPGPRDTRYVLGRRVLEMHPIVPIALGIGIGFAIMSYDGRLSISATADPALVPEAQDFPTLLREAAGELRARIEGASMAADENDRARPTPTHTPVLGDLMTRDPVTIAPHDTLATAWTLMRERRIRHLPVVERDGRMVGLVTHRDLLAASQSSLTIDREDERVHFLGAIAAFEIMETHLSTARANEPASDAGARMVRHKIGCLPVVRDGGHLVGVVTEEDFLRWATTHMTAAA